MLNRPFCLTTLITLFREKNREKGKIKSERERRKKGGQTNRYLDSQTGRQTDKQIPTHKQTKTENANPNPISV